MEDRINITGNAYFYSITKAISRRAIERAIVQATSNKKGPFVYRNIRSAHRVNGHDYVTTFIVFKYVSSPSFLTRGLEKEIKYGYLLFVEYNNYLVISRKGTASFVELSENFITELPYEKLAKFRVDSTTKINKMSVSSIETGKNVMRRQQVEANDLKEIYPTVTSSSKTIHSLRVKNNNHETAISISTSRINQLGKKNGLEDFCNLAGTICDAIDGYIPTTCFVDNFAEQLPFAPTIAALTPISVFFNLYQLIDDLSNDIVENIIYRGRNGSEREFDVKEMLEANDFCLSLIVTTNPKVFEVANKIAKDLQLFVGTKRIEFKSPKLRHIDIHYSNGEIVNLLDYINGEGLFIVAFNNSEIRYASKALYRDSKLIGNIDYFLGFIHTTSVLDCSTSEKGNTNSSSKSFDVDCLFGAIENNLASDCDFLMCDDLGDEWGDYIGLKKGAFIRFYHAKFSDTQYSATAFHDVVAQALKNIGHFDFNKDLSAKQSSISKPYSGSQIHRLRKGGNVAKCIACLKETYNSANVIKEVVLVVNFLNKSMLESELKKLKKGVTTKNQTIQILWQLSSLICVCQERGIKLKIITKG